jgi:N-acetylmuramoyl-L-alanine amidase-like protein
MGRKQKRATVAGVVAALAFAIWLTAPALSLGPYRPDPADFELRDTSLATQTRPGVRARSSATGSRAITLTRSRVLRAPKRFNLVGFRWRATPDASLSVRVRRGGARWSDWVRVPVDSDDAPDPVTREGAGSWSSSDPLWAGEADEVQYRIAAHRPVRTVHLHFVNTKGTSTPRDRLRTGLRRAVHTAITAVVSPFVETAGAQESVQPEIVTRDQWGASACPPRALPQYGVVKLAYIHHTVSATDYAPEDSAAMVLAICRYHRNSNRWNDIGYNFLVDRYGKVFEGRAGGMDQAVVGAQAQGYNTQSTGVANLGTFSTTSQTDDALAAVARLLSWKLALHGVPPQGKVSVVSAGGATNRFPAGTAVLLHRISGHRDANATSCPGDGLYAQLPRLREMVTPDPRPPTALALGASRSRIPYGRKVSLSGTLRAGDGSPLAGQRVRIQTLGGTATTSTLVNIDTDSAGAFAANVRLVFNRSVQATFEGSPQQRPAFSSALPIGVRPRVVASLAGASDRVAVGKRVAVRGSVRPRKRTALLLVDREGSDGAFRRVAKLPVKARLGRIRAGYAFKRPGRYRIRLGVDRDSRNFSARSAAILVTVG